MIKPILYLLLAICPLQIIYGQTKRIEQDYIDLWKKFYPSKALDQGFHAAIYSLEEYSLSNIDQWIAFNERTQEDISENTSSYNSSDKINIRMLRIQIRSELDKWKKKKVHYYSSELYSRIIEQSLKKVISANFLTISEQKEIIHLRMARISALCQSGIENLKSSSGKEVERSINQLNRTREFLLSEVSSIYPNPADLSIDLNFDEGLKMVMTNLDKFRDFLLNDLLPRSTTRDQILGKEAYAHALNLYTDTKLSPDQLAQMALNEIEIVKSLIGLKSKEYITNTYPESNVPLTIEGMIKWAFEDMEKDAPLNSQDYLIFWQELTKSTIEFIKEQDLATLPDYETLRIMPAPESAGPASRIGWVESAAPFAPNPLTTLYLPSIPDTIGEQERLDFWASFNKPFNRMIVIHELYPGHYMQIKKSRDSPHHIRLLFPYGPYFEGWASFCEIVALDAGWEAKRLLTYLAHLRKRLENANRAYTSVMVHCNGWDKQKVADFSVETSLLAPQFAKSLWGRLMRSPMQMTTYFLGGQQFRNLLDVEKKRLGSRFILKDFMDTILKSGPIPIDEFYNIFKEEKQ